MKIVNIYLPPISYACLIFFLSSRSFDSVNVQPGMDKVAHLILYTGFGYVVLRAFRKAGRQRMAGVWTVLIVMFYGMTDELHQYFVPGRQFEMFDLIFDSLGGCLALTFSMVADRKGWPIWF